MSKGIYDVASGQILQLVSGGTDEDVAAILQPGQDAIDVADETDATHYVANGELVAFPAQPDEHHVWSWSTHAWSDPRSIDDMKAAKWSELKAARDAAVGAGFTWDGSSFQSDENSRNQITGAALAASIAGAAMQPFQVTWTLTNNTVRVLSATDMIAVGFAMLAHIQAAYERGRQLKAQVDAATMISDIEAVSW